jgi:SlyX protein
MEKRLMNLEIKLAYLDKMVDELNGVIIEQQAQIEALTKRVDQAGDDAGSEIEGHAPPPHY